MLVDSPLVGAPLGAATTPTAPGRRPAARAAGWGASAVLPAALGAEQTALDQVWHGVFPHTGSDTGVAVRDGRPPRTLLGPPAGAALGLAGTAVRGPPATRSPAPASSASAPAPRPRWSPPSPSAGVPTGVLGGYLLRPPVTGRTAGRV
ncbi:hypothetical protein ACFXO2_28555 [Streptomyces sp. NPDC059152]|uniref:hypothetical protein n=1 Tax=Streptomyces sp. NPDC059152 TaxID=3346742 RepID=UPI0036B4A289